MAFSRRTFMKNLAMTGTALCCHGALSRNALAAADENVSTVYFTPECSAEALKKIYQKVRDRIKGKTAIKVHTGEPNGPNIIPPSWVQSFMEDVPQASIVECNVLYGSMRQTTQGHREVLKTNGWDKFAVVDIMDEFGDIDLPIKGGKQLTQVAVGKNLVNYDSMIVLTHFKGHIMGGFGGSLKNISIGCASGARGKEQIHREGGNLWASGPKFMERMVEGGKAVADYFGENIVYINVMRNISVSCDCEGVQASPVEIPNLGILASTDLLAVDKASVDMIYSLPGNAGAPLIERIESRSGLRQLTYMEELGMGNASYSLVTI